MSPVKVLFQVIQCLHHMSILQDGKRTKAFPHKVNELNRFIRPAVPNPQIVDKIQAVNSAWASNMVQALLTHYQDQLKTLKSCIPKYSFSQNEWSSIKSKSLQWGKKKFWS